MLDIGNIAEITSQILQNHEVLICSVLLSIIFTQFFYHI